MRWIVLLIACSCVLGAASRPGEGARARMERAAAALVASLDGAQRSRIVLAFGAREEWAFVPGDRPGVTLGEMGDASRARARDLIRASMSTRGCLKVEEIIQLENVLREMGEDPRFRDPGRYFVQVFAEPGSGKPWGWRIEGHHLSVLFTFGEGPRAAVTPMFMGANPGHVDRGSRAGLRVLAGEEEIARELLASMTAEQRAAGVETGRAPADVLLGPGKSWEVLGAERGLAWGEMREEQRAILRRLVEEYVGNLAEELAAEQRERMGDLSDVRFLWIGSEAPREGHYYRIRGKQWVIEYDNTQNGANHIHVLWRDVERDFGRDLLREHLERDHAR